MAIDLNAEIAGFEAEINSWFVNLQTEALTIYAKIVAGIDVAESDLAIVFKYVQNNGPTIVADLQEVLAIFQAVGVVVPGPVLIAANAAVAALNAIAVAQTAGQTTPQTAVAGIVAVEQAAQAKSQALLSVSTAAVKS